jgi:hypothetical protein
MSARVLLDEAGLLGKVIFISPRKKISTQSAVDIFLQERV